MIPVMQRTGGDCLRACLASIFEIAYEEAPDTDPPTDEIAARVYLQHKVVVAWLIERGVMKWDLHNPTSGPPILRRGELVHDDGSRMPANFVWPYPLGPIYYIGFGSSPRRAGSNHAVVMKHGEIVHDPHPDQDMTLDRITSISVLLARIPR